jgi:hypothetical protein
MGKRKIKITKGRKAARRTEMTMIMIIITPTTPSHLIWWV